MPISRAEFTVNGRTYRPPSQPVVVICLDGCAGEYLDAAIARGKMPNLQRMIADGYRGQARAALPTFTNVNNCCIVTGTPPSQTGIAGNYVIDPATGQEVMTNSSKFLRSDTILAAAADAGRKVTMVTAKDKLRELLSKNLRGISFSAEKANQVTRAINGIDDVESLVDPAPPIYSGEASVYVLRAGVALIETGRADFCYLTTTDYIQHKHAPDEPEAIEFNAAIDRELGRLFALNAVVAITADHGMNSKCDEHGNPKVIYLETLLTEKFGSGVRVICPITDPYVVHHGALGSFVTVYLPTTVDRAAVAQWVSDLVGVTEVHDRATAARELELPPDMIGDLVVLAGRDWVLGRTPAHHDLSVLAGPLRSHGGRAEEIVPLILSERLNAAYLARAAGDVRNFDVFEFVCNGISGQPSVPDEFPARATDNQ